MRWGVGLNLDGVVDLLIRPQTGDTDDRLLDLADVAYILFADVGRLRPPLPIAMLIDDQHAGLVRRRPEISPQHLQAAAIYGGRLPARLRQEPLQALDSGLLGTADRLGMGQGGQRLVAFSGQQYAFQVAAEGGALVDRPEAVIEGLAEGFERDRRWISRASAHGSTSCSGLSTLRTSTKDRLVPPPCSIPSGNVARETHVGSITDCGAVGLGRRGDRRQPG